MILLIGAGPMAQEYSKVLDAIGVEYDVLGRGAVSAEKFEKETGHNVILGGLSQYMEAAKVRPNTAIVSVSVEQLAKISNQLLAYEVKNILIEKPAGVTFDEIQEFSEAATHYNAKAFIAYNRRFYSSVTAAQKIIEEDGGVESFNFEITEWAHTIEKISKSPNVKENWFLGNTSHVVDLAFFLGGTPKEISCFTASKTSWHKRSANFSGAGVTKNNALFSYHGNWNAPGRWSVEMLTRKHRLIFRPIEKLQIQKIATVKIEEVEIDDALDVRFKPGLFKQVDCFLKGETSYLCSIQEHAINCQYYAKMANYK